MTTEVKHISYNPSMHGQTALSVCELYEDDGWILEKVVPVSPYESVIVLTRWTEEQAAQPYPTVLNTCIPSLMDNRARYIETPSGRISVAVLNALMQQAQLLGQAVMLRVDREIVADHDVDKWFKMTGDLEIAVRVYAESVHTISVPARPTTNAQSIKVPSIWGPVRTIAVHIKTAGEPS